MDEQCIKKYRNKGERVIESLVLESEEQSDRGEGEHRRRSALPLRTKRFKWQVSSTDSSVRTLSRWRHSPPLVFVDKPQNAKKTENNTTELIEREPT